MINTFSYVRKRVKKWTAKPALYVLIVHAGTSTVRRFEVHKFTVTCIRYSINMVQLKRAHDMYGIKDLQVAARTCWLGATRAVFPFVEAFTGLATQAALII